LKVDDKEDEEEVSAFFGTINNYCPLLSKLKESKDSEEEVSTLFGTIYLCFTK